MITVRNATLDDLPFLLAELAHMDEFFGSRRSLFPDVDTAERIVGNLIEHHPFFVAEDVNGPVGFIAGALQPHFLNPDILQLTEVFWWVVMESRGSRAGALLFAAFDECGRKHAHWVTMSLNENTPIEPKSLERRGYHLRETSYLKEVC